MMLFHGTRLYAVDSRDIGTFGGRAQRATLKIYDGSNAGSARTTVSDTELRCVMLDDLKEFAGDHERINTYLRRFLPSNDPYVLGPGTYPAS